MLADLVRKVGDETLLVLLDGENVCRCRTCVVLSGSDNTIGGGDVVAVEVRGELHRQLDSLTQERDTCKDGLGCD